MCSPNRKYHFQQWEAWHVLQLWSSLMSQAVHWWSPFNSQKVIWMRMRKEMWMRNFSYSAFYEWIKASFSREANILTSQAKMQPGKVCSWLHICLLQSSRQHGWEQNPSSCCSSPFNHRSWDLVNTSLQTAPAWMPEAHQLQSGWILDILFPEKTSATSALCLLPNLVHGLPLHACYQFGVSPNTKQGWLGVWWCWGNAWVSSGGLLGIVKDGSRKNWHCPQRQRWDVSREHMVWTPTISDQHGSEKEINL